MTDPRQSEVLRRLSDRYAEPPDDREHYADCPQDPCECDDIETALKFDEADRALKMEKGE